MRENSSTSDPEGVPGPERPQAENAQRQYERTVRVPGYVTDTTEPTTWSPMDRQETTESVPTDIAPAHREAVSTGNYPVENDP